MAFKPNFFRDNTTEQVRQVEKCLDYLVKNNQFYKEGNKIIVALPKIAVSTFGIHTPLPTDVVNGVRYLYQQHEWAAVYYNPPHKVADKDGNLKDTDPSFSFFEEDPTEGRNRV